MKSQSLLNSFKEIKKTINENDYKKPFIVCRTFITKSFIMEFIDSLGIEYITYTAFTPNPKYEEVVKGIKKYLDGNCDFIISIGGGSAIDVAKCINLFLPLDQSKNYLEQKYNKCKTKHLAIPTTAGTGSESTKYAVIYYNDVKQSITEESIIPEFVILEPSFLETVPDYQKKSTLLDALCQGIESYWSINSTEESKKYAKESINLIMSNYEAYIKNIDHDINSKIMFAANLSGKAINITQTTSAHAMSYKITSLYEISHGHAVALVLPYIWEYMINNIDKCEDKRGKEYLNNIFTEINNMFECNTSKESIEKFKKIYKYMSLSNPWLSNEEELVALTNSVNEKRLKNNPVSLNKETILKIYKEALAK